MARGNANVIPIHRRLHKNDNRRLMQFEQEELSYDLAHGYPLRIDDWGTCTATASAEGGYGLIYEVVGGQGMFRPMTDEEKTEHMKIMAIPQHKPWWRRLMDWGTLVAPVDAQAKRAKLDAAIKQLKPWWLRWMVRFGEWMGWGA